MMPYYDLAIVDEPGRVLFTPAKDREEALAILGKELGQLLTLDEQETVADYLLDEWHEAVHWSNPTIPVFKISN